MKKLTLAILASSLMCSQYANADALGLTFGIDFWQINPDITTGDAGKTAALAVGDQHELKLFGRFEHPIPFLPNLAVSYQNLSFDASTTLSGAWQLDGRAYAANTLVTTNTTVKQADITAYYELLDNDIVNLDMGITGRLLRSETFASSASLKANADFSAPLPMLYARADIAILGTKTHLFADGNYTSYSDNRWMDARIGIMYDLIDLPLLTGSLSAGMQLSDGQLYNEDGLDADYHFNGLFAGVQVDF